MKKLLAMALITSMLALPGMALADQNGSGASAGSAGSPEDIAAVSLPAEEDVPVVGEDIAIEDGEFKIVSVEEDTPEEAPVVGEGIEIGEDEVKILSVSDEEAPAAGEEMSLEEAQILSVQSGLAESDGASDIQQSESNNTFLFAGIGAGAALLAGSGVILSKKRKKMSK